MARYLITQSLLSAWSYAHTCYESCAEEAYEEFLNALNRVPKETTPEMQNGIDFENEVYAEAAGVPRTPHPSWENGIKAVATVIKGAQTQVKAQREYTVGNKTLLVYGVLDALKAGVIYDVKFSNKSFNSAELAGKYLDAAQHSAYLYLIPEAYRFEYLVSDGEDIYTEPYTPKTSRPFEEIAAEFLESIEAMGLMSIYEEKWAAL